MNNESETALIEVWFTKKKIYINKNKAQKSPWISSRYLTTNSYVFYKVANSYNITHVILYDFCERWV